MNLDISMDFIILYHFEVFILNLKKNERPFVILFFHLKCYKHSTYKGLPKFGACPPIPLEEKSP